MRKTASKSPALRGPAIHELHKDVGRDQVIRIALAGAGGNGSQMVTCLARMDRALRHLGIAQIWLDLYDPETVTEANIGRQLFFPSEIGQSKARALIQRANLGFGLQWQAINEKYEGQLSRSGDCRTGPGISVRSQYDFLITCVDSGFARFEIFQKLRAGDHLMPAARYWLDLGNEGSSGQVVLGEVSRLQAHMDFTEAERAREAGGRLPTVVERWPQFFDGTVPETNAPSCSLAEALENQDLFVNDHVSRWAAHLLWTLLRRRKIGHCGYFINLEDGRVNPIRVEKAAQATVDPQTAHPEYAEAV